MTKMDEVMSAETIDIPRVSEKISIEDLKALVDLLSEKNDTIRYKALLLLQSRSEKTSDLYPYWDIFQDKLKSINSYQRSIGLMMIAANVKWDTENKTDTAIEAFLALLNDEKPITIRQCIQALHQVIPYKAHLYGIITSALLSVNIVNIKETMRKLVLTDILGVLAEIRKQHRTDEVENYIFKALSGDLLDKKAKKIIESLL